MVGSGGFGVITSSNFFTPQVNVSGSMASFVAPAAVVSQSPAPLPPGGGKAAGLRPPSSPSAPGLSAGLIGWLPLLALAGWFLLAPSRD